MILRKNRRKLIKDILIFGGAIVLLLGAALFVWVATIDLPDLNNFETRKVANSTKIFDRTGKVLLYNIHQDIKRTEVSSLEISDYIKQAHIAVEDASFYSHNGIRPTSIVRAVIENILPGGSSSGGSTITQQVIKNAVLTRERAVTRKIKEWILAIKLERILTKEQILTIYLNESPYGGTIYGVEEASRAYFKKSASEINLTEAAYSRQCHNALRISHHTEKIGPL
jgi:penicillin-binding protein 1A